MGRHGRMAAAEPQEEPKKSDPVGSAHDAASLQDHGPDYDRNRGVIDDPDRYAYLTGFTINRPESPLRDDAITYAARVWVCTEKKSDKRDKDAMSFLSNYMYSDGLYLGVVDPRRALSKAAVDSWLEITKLGATSARTYRAILYAAGRIVYPGEFPPPLTYTAPRGTPTQPTSRKLITELYGLAPALPPVHRLRTQLILDLTTEAGLRSPEILDLRGSDVTALTTHSGDTVAVIRVHRRGKVDRMVPVVCPIRSKRLLDRARDVGRGYFLPTPSGAKPYASSVANAFQYLRERGFPTTNANALRARWAIDLTEKSFPTAALARLCGKSLFRALATHFDDLPTYDTEELAEMLLRARRTR